MSAEIYKKERSQKTMELRKDKYGRGAASEKTLDIFSGLAVNQR